MYIVCFKKFLALVFCTFPDSCFLYHAAERFYRNVSHSIIEMTSSTCYCDICNSDYAMCRIFSHHFMFYTASNQRLMPNPNPHFISAFNSKSIGATKYVVPPPPSLGFYLGARLELESRSTQQRQSSVAHHFES